MSDVEKTCQKMKHSIVKVCQRTDEINVLRDTNTGEFKKPRGFTRTQPILKNLGVIVTCLTQLSHS